MARHWVYACGQPTQQSFACRFMRRFLLAVATYNVSCSVKVLGLVEPDECHLFSLQVLVNEELEKGPKSIVEPQLS